MMGPRKIITNVEAEEAFAPEQNEGLFVVVEQDDTGKVLEVYLVKSDSLESSVNEVRTLSANTDVVYVLRYGLTVPRRFRFVPAEAAHWEWDNDG